jgi:RNA polymerase sigma-70 factor (ECF subfamily)
MTEDRLTHLYRLYGSVIHDRCRSLLRNDADAEDATHETFLRVHRYLDRVPGTREALFWIYRVATNHCLNEIRGRNARAVPAGGRLDVPTIDPEPERRLSDRDLARRLIDEMPPKLRAAAWLYHVDGFEQEEVARILDISRRTVVTRLAAFTERARRFVQRRPGA